MQNVVARENRAAVEGDVRITRGFRAGGDEDLVGSDGARGALDVLQAEGVRILKRRGGGQHFDVVAQQLIMRHVDFVAHDGADTVQQVGRGELLADRPRQAVELAVAVTGEFEDGFAECL